MKKLLLAGLAFVSINAFAQQLPQYSQYNRNQFMVNPGAAGVYDFTDITIGGRYQWVGFDHPPMTAYAYGSTVLSRNKSRYNPSLRTSNGPFAAPKANTGKLKHAVGGQVIADQYGAFQEISVAGTYAIHLPLSRNVNISFGTKVGVSNSSFIQERATVLTSMQGYNGPAVSDAQYDAFVANQNNLNYLDIGAGFYLYSQDFYVGISADQLTRNAIQFGSGSANFDPSVHLNVMVGYKFDLNDNMTLMPSMLVKLMPPAPVSVEGSLQFEYKEWLWFGGSYRFNDALIGMVGCNLSNTFKVGYSYDFTISQLNSYNSGGHELILGIMLGR